MKLRAMQGWGFGGDEPETLSSQKAWPAPASLPDAHPTPTRVMMFPSPVFQHLFPPQDWNSEVLARG